MARETSYYCDWTGTGRKHSADVTCIVTKDNETFEACHTHLGKLITDKLTAGHAEVKVRALGNRNGALHVID